MAAVCLPASNCQSVLMWTVSEHKSGMVHCDTRHGSHNTNTQQHLRKSFIISSDTNSKQNETEFCGKEVNSHLI